MDFTELYRHTSGLVQISPGAQFVLTAVEDRLVVRRTESFQIARTWLVDNSHSPSALVLSNPSGQQAKPKSSAGPQDGWITHIGWSSDSEYILAACARRSVVNVYKLRDEEWTARIEAGVEGLVKAEWAPDGRSILCFSEWGLRVTIWSLVTGTATYIQFPKYPDKGWAFRADGRYFVLAERHKSKDTLGVYDAADGYKVIRHYSVPTSSMASFVLSPKGSELAVWEGPLEYKLCIMSLAGDHIATFTPTVDPGLGIRAVSWHRSGSFLVVGGYDEKVHVLNNITWKSVATLEFSHRIPANSNANVWREPSNWLESTHGRGYLSYDRLSLPVSISVERADPAKPHPRTGVAQLTWNVDGTLLLIRFEQAPTAAFIYSFPGPGDPFNVTLRSVLLQSKPISYARWNPIKAGNLCISCDNGALYTWSDDWVGDDGVNEIAECIAIPAKKFQAREVRWAADGKGIMILDKDVFCCAYDAESEDPVVN
ncbi:YVTN repeat-like/Quino protein amine dehydrogenase [Exidia glandulosa HHB12029]|uniref:YVTN repeat-like/Quino protein amine dehydrogenase n=1 Tax=Exidia glandulosa HHB12029 TaxID=1314781 RepID=A0A165N5H6_EXIGL|nr:YVTN repeat-like/Quino protein amine dehydrogenase [Exidia glandulosa HHB12029]